MIKSPRSRHILKKRNLWYDSQNKWDNPTKQREMDKLTNLFKVSKLLNFTESARVSTKLKSGVSNADTSISSN